MSIFDRIFRSNAGASGDGQDLSPTQVFNMTQTVAGRPVDENTALTYAGVWACTKIISESIACLPWHMIERANRHRRVIDHPLSYLLDVQPNDEVDAVSYRESATRDALLWGNHYAEAQRDRSGEVIALWRIRPDRVELKRDAKGRLVYAVSDSKSGNEILTPGEAFHVKGPTNSGLVGLSTVNYARESISMGLAVEDFGAALFGNGAKPSGLLVNKGKALTPEGIRNALKSFEDRHRSARNAHKIGYVDAGLEYVATSIPPEDAQFLQSRKFNITDVARWFRVPPHKLAELERSTHTNIEAQNIEFATDTLLPWVKRFEAAVRSRLIVDRKYDSKISMEGILRADSAARGAFHQTLFNIGAKSINEIRQDEDLPPIENGDGHYVQMNLQDVASVGSETATQGAARAFAIAEAAHKCDAIAANALKRCTTGLKLTAWITKQADTSAGVLRGLLVGHDIEACKSYLSDTLRGFATGPAASMTPADASEALRGQFAASIIKYFTELN